MDRPSDERITRENLGALWARLYEEQLRLREEVTRLEEQAARGDDHGGDEKIRGSTEKPAEEADEKATKRPLRERVRAWFAEHRRARVAIPVALVLVLAGGAVLVHWLHSFESTDDAQVDADISAIGARVTGTVVRVHVTDNQYVKAGDLLVEIDPADYRVALAQAEANLAQAEAQAKAQEPSVPITQTTNATQIATSGGDVETTSAELAAAEREDESARAHLAQVEAQNRLSHTDRERAQNLVRSGALPPQELDKAVAAADAADAELAAATAALAAADKRVEQQRARVGQASTKLHEARANAPEQLEITRATLASREAQVKAARAALDRARLDLTYTEVRAPVAGIVGKKTVNVGDHVQPGQQVLAIVQTDRLWVTANFKETQLERMAPGQRARVSVDAFGATYDATVESLPGASGAKYSLFPPENATGNFVKVVQRLPVRLRFHEGQAGLERLRPGMSVEPKVYLP